MLCSTHLICLTESWYVVPNIFDHIWSRHIWSVWQRAPLMIPNWSRFPAPRRLLILLKDNSFFKYLSLIFNILISLTYLICWYDSKLVEVSGSPEAVNGSSVVLPWNAFQMGQSLMAPVSSVQWNRPVFILLKKIFFLQFKEYQTSQAIGVSKSVFLLNNWISWRNLCGG